MVSLSNHAQNIVIIKLSVLLPCQSASFKINPDIHYPNYKRNLSSIGKFVVQFRNSDTCHSRKQEIKSKEPPTDLDSSGRKTTIYPSITKKKAKLPLVFTKSGWHWVYGNDRDTSICSLSVIKWNCSYDYLIYNIMADKLHAQYLGFFTFENVITTFFTCEIIK